MSDRGDLSELIEKAIHSGRNTWAVAVSRGPETYETAPKLPYEVDAVVSAVLTAGWTRNRTVNPNEVEAMPEGTIIYAEDMRRPFLKEDDGWFSLWVSDKPVYDYIRQIVAGELKAVVLFQPFP